MNELLDQLAAIEIKNQLHALSEGRPYERCIWVENGAPQAVDAMLNGAADERFRRFTAYLSRADRSVFAPFKRLLQETQPIWSQWTWIEHYKHELNTLLPGTFGDEFSVQRIGTGWSEVRLNGEIAWGFRLLQFLSVFVQKLAQEQPLVLVLHDFQYADRLSIQLVYHLLHNVKAQNVLVILSRRAYDIDGDVSALDDGTAIDKLFARFLKKVEPLYLSGESYAFDATDFEIERPVAPEPLSAKDNVSAALAALRSGEYNIHKVLASLHEALVWYNFDNTLLLAGEILNRLEEIDESQVAHVQFEVWRHVGIAHAFMGHFGESLHAFNQMYDNAATLAEQAKAIHFLALLYGKRMKRWDISKKLVYEGLEMTKDSTEFDVIYERCWLYNYLAYVNYSVERDFKTAMTHTLTAYREMMPFKGYNRQGNVNDEIADPKLPIRLLGNVEANIAYLHYYSGRYDLAMTTWKGAVPKFTGQAPLYFRKEYYHFEGNIHRKMGNFTQADESYQYAYQICIDHHDPFHAEMVAQSLGHTHFLSGNFGEAAKWYERSLQLKHEVGDVRLAKCYSSIIMSHLRNGNHDAAQTLFDAQEKRLDPRFRTLYITSQLLNCDYNEFLEQGPPILVQAYPQMHI
ncbi:MAG: tetratricopeptide repeat protein [Tumebacillaceae bacterium]